jgi:hypothetical protein
MYSGRGRKITKLLQDTNKKGSAGAHTHTHTHTHKIQNILKPHSQTEKYIQKQHLPNEMP